ncbi:hypothetical protein T261_04130 [Streptomyces lydicus]|nr:hypothetical protein T261_04130 [Streptomyces lydicus]
MTVTTAALLPTQPYSRPPSAGTIVLQPFPVGVGTQVSLKSVER